MSTPVRQRRHWIPVWHFSLNPYCADRQSRGLRDQAGGVAQALLAAATATAAGPSVRRGPETLPLVPGAVAAVGVREEPHPQPVQHGGERAVTDELQGEGHSNRRPVLVPDGPRMLTQIPGPRLRLRR
jgi:hypothetical protein